MEQRTHRCVSSATFPLILLLVSCASLAFASDTATVSLFSPDAFYRNTGAPGPVVRTFSVPAVEGTFALRVENGDGATDNLISSAVVKVNGMTVVKTSDLSQQVATVERSLTNLVKGANTLEVEVRSVPSSYITVSIAGTYLLGVTITEPAPSASIASDRVTVQGTYVGYTGDVGVAVNGVRAAVSGNSFVAEDVPLMPGNNTLTATITTVEGVQNADDEIVSATGAKPMLSLWANYSSGVPPFAVSFRPGIEGIEPVVYQYDFNGDGAVDNTVSAGEVITFAYQTPGTYRATVIAVDGAGHRYEAKKIIVVQDRWATDAILAGRWNALSTSLRAQDVQGGLTNFLPESRETHQAIFTPLLPQLPTIFSSVSPPELIAVEGDIAQYRVKREQLFDGLRQTITYYVWFVKDKDGVWRIDRF